MILLLTLLSVNMIGWPNLAWCCGRLPDTVLWAWQRQEDLSSLDARHFGVAYLASHIRLAGERVIVERRAQPLKVPKDACLVPVVRIDCDRLSAPCLSGSQMRSAARAIADAFYLPQTAMLQIDFDALVSQREFYADLIKEVKSQIPPDSPLSITALASWCLFDKWMDNLPVQEVVPMMFSLGRDRQKVLLYFKQGHDFLDQKSKGALGISLEDTEINGIMLPLLLKRSCPARLYVFSRTAWTSEKIDKVNLMRNGR